LDTPRGPGLFCFYRLDFIGLAAGGVVAMTQGLPADFR